MLRENQDTELSVRHHFSCKLHVHVCTQTCSRKASEGLIRDLCIMNSCVVFSFSFISFRCFYFGVMMTEIFFFEIIEGIYNRGAGVSCNRTMLDHKCHYRVINSPSFSNRSVTVWNPLNPRKTMTVSHPKKLIWPKKLIGME